MVNCSLKLYQNIIAYSRLTYLLTLTLVVYLPPSYQILSLLWRAFLKLFYLFLHFVLLVYSFLIHVIEFSKQICFQSFLKLVNVFTVFNYHC